MSVHAPTEGPQQVIETAIAVSSDDLHGNLLLLVVILCLFICQSMEAGSSDSSPFLTTEAWALAAASTTAPPVANGQ